MKDIKKMVDEEIKRIREFKWKILCVGSNNMENVSRNEAEIVIIKQMREMV